MPIRELDPFKDPTEKLATGINPYVGHIQSGMRDQTLPVAYGPGLREWCRVGFREVLAERMICPPRRIIAEVGCHEGHVLSKLARDHPEVGFVGLDITFKRVVETARRAVALGASNLVSVFANGKTLAKLFGEGSLDGMIVFFPDPWARKKKQQKKRLIDAGFLEDLRSVLRPGGFFWLKTDHEGYFHEVADLCAGLGWISAVSADDPILNTGHPSCFEEAFARRAVPTFSRIWYNAPFQEEAK